MLFALTRTPVEGSEITIGGHVPAFVYLALALYLGVGLILMLAAFMRVSRWKKHKFERHIPLANTQIVIWMFLLVVGIALLATCDFAVGLLLTLLAQLLPRDREKAEVQHAPRHH